MKTNVQHQPYSTASIAEYYSKVYGMDLQTTDLAFPKDNRLKAVMIVSPDIDELEIMKNISDYFEVSLFRYKWEKGEELKIDRSSEQSRPKSLYVLAHTGEEESDFKHKGKSYDMAIAEKMIFANPKEYLLMTGYHMFITGRFMDLKSYTRTSSVWKDGFVVGLDFRGEENMLKLGHGDRNTDLQCMYHGPREIVIGS